MDSLIESLNYYDHDPRSAFQRIYRQVVEAGFVHAGNPDRMARELHRIRTVEGAKLTDAHNLILDSIRLAQSEIEGEGLDE